MIPAYVGEEFGAAVVGAGVGAAVVGPLLGAPEVGAVVVGTAVGTLALGAAVGNPALSVALLTHRSPASLVAPAVLHCRPSPQGVPSGPKALRVLVLVR